MAAAEDAVQEAFVEALRTWPDRGVPSRPGAWITTTARNRAFDRARQESRRAAREAAATLIAPGTAAQGAAGVWGSGGDDGGRHSRHDDSNGHDAGRAAGEVNPVADDQLRMIFTCCHPALAPAAQVGLTLRMVCGLQVAEIARAFLQSEATVYQRLTRAKAKIRTTNIPFRVPPAPLLQERVPPVLSCIYLVFSEGYAASAGADLIRHGLCDEGIRLARLVVELLPEEAEARGLLALMLLQDSRRTARLGPEGELVLLEDQDRTGWDRTRIAEGRAELDRALRAGPPGAYRLQAAIAAEHADARAWADTDWPRIAALYGDLARLLPSPVVEVNRAVAVGFADGPAAGLAVIDGVADDPRLARSHVLPATRADLLRRLGHRDEAAHAYRTALSRVGTSAERAFLERRLFEITLDG
jgi:RNA polymerase sigma-70 factor (ECF subfamily)